ncbi:FAD/NAD(P)-binding protein [Lentilactobacillus sp. Marseille-Q4993]|uniref:FAD/NAD(P)-binding protein n=1 Tax=Lentilactobacillus sp. Marseille-Q4993 TaxID=3039492 RepID=UPI0024BCA725|nr:FAD/NAD(P)-binding protein [Lentilactobacillus sp. Marseille-Q4993]
MKIAIVGAGPRGVLVASSLLNQYKHRTNQSEKLEIKLYDPYGIGGRVWRTDQWEGLIMNSPADQVSLFTDSSVNTKATIFDGPSLYEWLATDESESFMKEIGFEETTIWGTKVIKGNEYPARILYGAYIQWVFKELQTKVPHNVSLEVVKSQVINLSNETDDQVLVETSEKSEVFNKVVMALGQQDNYLNDEEQKLASYAEEHDLTYLQPTHPGDVNVDDLPAGEPVLIRGLSLSFIDYVSELTIGRGGRYIENDDGNLFYQPSGREPKIIAGSHHGMPYYPKPISEKRYGEMLKPVFLTDENIENNLENGKLPFEKFLDLLKLDLQLNYYTRLIDDAYPFKSATEFKRAFIDATDKQAVIDSYGFSEMDSFDWDYINDPFKDVQMISTTDYQMVLVDWLNSVYSDAMKGSKSGPITSTLELLRDYVPTFRKLVAEHRFSNDEFVRDFRGSFLRDRNFLAVGAPALRTAQLSALIRAGIVTVMAPGMEVKPKDGWFVAGSPKRNTDVFKSSVLIEARVPKADIENTSNPLLEELKRNAMIHERSLKVRDEDTGLFAVDVNEDTDQMLTSTGTPQPSIYIWGVPLDGIRFATTASPRPGVNDPNFQTADKLAGLMLGLEVADDVRMM